MRRRFPFALKLGLSFAIVILVSVALVYFLTVRSITSCFSAFREQSKQQVASQVIDLLAEYRVRTGGWKGIEQLLSRRYSVLINGRLIVRRTSLIGDFSLADEDDSVVVSTDADRVGNQLSEGELEDGTPIQLEGNYLGTLVLYGGESILTPAEETFLSSAKRSALMGGGIASGIALLLSAILISQIISPLRMLTRATERIASGNLTQQVRLKARDEFGQLGASFNRMMENLHRSEKARRNMTADIAHELRTPVTIIQGNLEAVLDGIYRPDSQTIAPIYEETLHLGHLIDDLRELALAEAGELRLEREETDLSALVNQLTETINPSLEEGREISIESEPFPLLVEIDPKRIRQVIVNLLSNAIRYTPPGGKVTISLARRKDEVEIRISDRGPGIPPAVLPHLFERFYRGDHARDRGEGGSGLGLAIVRQWVEAHGGRIRAENNESGGASFIILLPFT
ncbi:MAG: ATP-binding protein [Candidatus Bipolaricaulota bacterium]|nr:ATP-binding protein [Candidatus Bipolaricaulota bacterium]